MYCMQCTYIEIESSADHWAPYRQATISACVLYPKYGAHLLWQNALLEVTIAAGDFSPPNFVVASRGVLYSWIPRRRNDRGNLCSFTTFDAICPFIYSPWNRGRVHPVKSMHLRLLHSLSFVVSRAQLCTAHPCCFADTWRWYCG